MGVTLDGFPQIGNFEAPQRCMECKESLGALLWNMRALFRKTPRCSWSHSFAFALAVKKGNANDHHEGTFNFAASLAARRLQSPGQSSKQSAKRGSP